MKPIYKQTMVIDHVATGKAIRAYREQRGISTVMIATRLGIGRPMISKLEAGK